MDQRFPPFWAIMMARRRFTECAGLAMASKRWAWGLGNVIVCRERGTVVRIVFMTNSLLTLIWSALAIRNNSCRLCWFASWKTLFKNGAWRSMRHSMCLEFRQRPMSFYGKNRPTPATQFAMIMLLHVISTPFIQDCFILFVPVKSKCDGFSLFSCHFNVAEPAVGVSWPP